MALNKNDKDENKGLKGAWNVISKKDETTKNSYLSSTWGGLKAGASTLGFSFVAATGILFGTLAVMDEEYVVMNTDYELANDSNFNQTTNHAVVELDGNYYMVTQDPEDSDRWQLYIGESNLRGDIEFTLVTSEIEALSTIMRVKALIDVDANSHNLNVPYRNMDYYTIRDISGHYEEDGKVNRLVINSFEGYSYNASHFKALELFTEASENLQRSFGAYGFTTAPEIVDDPHADAEDFLLAFAVAGSVIGAGAAAAGGVIGSAAGASAEGIERAVNRRRRRKDEKGKNIPKP